MVNVLDKDDWEKNVLLKFDKNNICKTDEDFMLSQTNIEPLKMKHVLVAKNVKIVTVLVHINMTEI